MGCSLDYSLNVGSGLHQLVRGKVADVSGANRKDVFTKDGVLLVHHLLYNGSGVHARKVVVLEGGHKRNSASCHHKVVGVYVVNFVGDDVLNGNSFSI